MSVAYVVTVASGALKILSHASDLQLVACYDVNYCLPRDEGSLQVSVKLLYVCMLQAQIGAGNILAHSQMLCWQFLAKQNTR